MKVEVGKGFGIDEWDSNALPAKPVTKKLLRELKAAGWTVVRVPTPKTSPNAPRKPAKRRKP